MTNNIWITPSAFHFMEGPQFFRIRFQWCLYFGPFEVLMAVHVFLKTGLQYSEELFALFV